MNFFDTITALSTPYGTSGIAVIRVSGVNAFDITNKIFKSKSINDLNNAKSHSVIHGFIKDSDDYVIDDVLVTVFKAPKSFTGENTVEISCHGSMAVVKLIIKELIKNGARTAQNGEFTKRAFLNGKLDLTQAEAVLDIINSQDEYNLYSAENHLKGILKEKIQSLRRVLIDTVSNIIAVIDYPDEDIDELGIASIIENLENVYSEISNLQNSYNTGKIIKEGVKIVIVGKPNVGKSSLLNALLKENRAIVTDIAGTTRDILEESISIDGLKAKITDTAGIRESNDIIEKIGIDRTKESIDKADLVLFVVDKSKPLSDEDYILIDMLKDKNVFLLLNKSDLTSVISADEIKKLIPCKELFEVSAKNFTGLNELTQKIKNSILNDEINIRENTYITNERHFEELTNASIHLKKVIADLKSGIFPDIVTIDMENAISSLGGITGETVNEEIINNIFKNFCVGK